MAKIVGAVGRARPTIHAKRIIAGSMYRKGMSFIGAALLLRRNRGDEYVVLHLLCQGTELLLKGLLLIKDYDSFKSKLRKPIGHDLVKASDEVSKVFGTPKVKGQTREQLKQLNTLYKEHLLRYGTFHDIFIDASTIPSGRVLHRVAALMKRVEKLGLFHGTAI